MASKIQLIMSLAQSAKKRPIIAEYSMVLPIPASFGLPADMRMSTPPIIMAIVANDKAISTKKSKILLSIKLTLSQVQGQSGVPEQVTMPPVGQSAKAIKGVMSVDTNNKR